MTRVACSCSPQAYESVQQQVLKGSALSVSSFHPEAISSSFASESEPQARRGRCSQSRWQTRSQESFRLLQKQPQSERRKRSKQCPEFYHSKSDCGKPFCIRRPSLAPTHFNQNSPPLHPQSLIVLILLILLIAAKSANAFALHTFPCCGNLWQFSQLSASTLVADWLT